MSAPVVPCWAEDGEEFVLGYMCLTDFEVELGGNADGNRVFPSIGALEETFSCVRHCGIVEVEIKARRIVRPAVDEPLDTKNEA